MAEVRHLEEEQREVLAATDEDELVTVGLGEAQWGRGLETEGNSGDISSSFSLFS